MEYASTLFKKTLPVFWWIAVWGLTEMLMEWATKNHLPSRLFFYGGMIAIVLILVGTDISYTHHF